LNRCSTTVIIRVFCLSNNRGNNSNTVGQTKNYIELNGKRYDAATGELLAHVPLAAHKVTTSVTAIARVKAASRGKVIDGFIKTTSKTNRQPTAHHTKPVATHQVTQSAASKTVATAKPIMDVYRATGQHVAHHQPERSKTLMRKAVKRPMPSLKSTLKPQTRTDILAKVPAHHLLTKLSSHHIDEKRLKRAERVAKNNLVSRFGTVQITTHASRPIQTHTRPTVPIITTHNQDIKPVYASSAASIARTQPSLDIFEQALARANSHKETFVDPKKLKHATKKHRGIGRKLINTGASIMAVLLIGGFIAYQNTANIQMRVASAKAGFHANMPGYKPAGFAVGKFNYAAGYVAVNFHSNSDNRVFNITQKVSNWNSASLLSEYVSNAAGKSYQTLDASGRTIYTYGNNNATWMDSGVWYNVTSNGALSTSQLVDLATSM
jgi:hypothetical protein